VFVMMQRQMLGIRDRAQRTAVVAAPTVQAEKPPRAKTNGQVVDHPDRTEVVASAN